jgi:hypothetical protein
MRTIRSIVALSTALIALVAFAAPAAQADTKGLADAIMRMDYNTFVQYAGIQAPPPFDWSTDGCSSPTPASLRRLFSRPCELHDFGYRNYGHGLRLGANEDVRAWIDGRFLEEMQRLCRDSFPRWWQQANKATCFTQASGIWSAVRNFGREAFYNG